jgi:hypothetical protein
VLTNIVAPHGKVGSDGMGNVDTLGLILKGETWDPPSNIKCMKQQKKPKQVMKISKVFAPNLKIVGFHPGKWSDLPGMFERLCNIKTI